MALDLESGDEQWRFEEFSRYNPFPPTPVVQDGVAAFTNTYGIVWLLEAA